MSETRPKKLGGNAFGFVALAFVLILVGLLPLQAPSDAAAVIVGDRLMVTGPAAPDVLLGVTLAWLLRRPDQLPVLVVVAVFLFRDLVTGAPPGVSALAILAVGEVLRARHVPLREAGFLVEWAMVGTMMVLFTLLCTALQLALFLPTPPLAGSVLSTALSMVIYPIIVVVLIWAVGLHKSAPGTRDEIGHRI